MNYKVGQKVYKVAISVLSGVCETEEQIILCVGETVLFAVGKDPEWQSRAECLLHYNNHDNLNKPEIIHSSRQSFWTDTIEKAMVYKKEINDLLKAKKELL